jgi:hypothetical protein
MSATPMPAPTAATAVDPDEAAQIALDRRSALPAGLAALAEASYLYVPAHLLAVDAANVSGGPFANAWAFVAIMAASVVVLTRLRRFKAGVTIAAGATICLGVVQATVWGQTDLAGTVATVLIALVIGLRVVALSLRDWRNPFRESFVVGSIALLLEAAFAGNHPEFQGVVTPMVLLFFVSALGSRAASIRLARPLPLEPSPDESEAGRRWFRTTFLVLGGLGLLLGVSVAFGGEHGGIAAIGHVVLTAVGQIVGFVILVVARVLLGPLNAVLSRLHIDLRAFKQLADTLNAFGQNAQHTGSGSGNVLERLLGLAVLVALGFLLVRAMRRHFQLLDREGPETSDVPPPEASPLGPRGRLRRRAALRREMPADTVRRWYAEALLMLERRGLAKPPASTPAEFLQDVRGVYPECGPEFAVLTRAYEEVRYGSRTFERPTLDRLEAHRLQLMGALHRAKKLEPTGGES